MDSADRLATDKAVSSTAFRTHKYGTVHVRNTMNIEDLKQHYAYNADTGEFTHIKPRTPRIRKGSVAGCLRNGYVVLKHRGRQYYAHRVAYAFMYSSIPEHCIDHINGDKRDNRWVNLRPATYSENNQNAVVRKHNITGLKGVKADLRRGNYTAGITIKGKYKYLGVFNTPEEAHCAYTAAADKHFGAFAQHGKRTV